MKISTAAQLMGVERLAPPEFFDKEISGFSIDSRTVAAGELFFALAAVDYRRHHFTAAQFDDGHQYIAQAFARGAVGVVALRERVAADAELQALSARLLLVDDVIAALQALAHGIVEHWGGQTVGITGSAGKTTVKDLTAHVLKQSGRRVLKTQKNYNNQLGLPLSILQMVSGAARPADYDVAVLEYGMSTFGEIGKLTHIAPPDIGVELLIAPAHLEFFESVEQIAAGKAQLIENLKPGGIAVLNADDERVLAMRAKHAGRTLTFGMDTTADVMAADIECARIGLSRFRLCTPLGEAMAELPLPGRHNLSNALAAAAVATCFGLTPEESAHALATARPTEMRGEVLDFADGFSVIDDSYNSNPASLLSMTRALAEGRGAGGAEQVRRTVVVAGEMLELGADGATLHRAAGREIAELGVDVLWGVRGLASELIAGAQDAGLNERARFFATTEEAAAALLDEVRPGDLVLVKGSRSVRTDKIVAALRARFSTVDADEAAT